MLTPPLSFLAFLEMTAAKYSSRVALSYFREGEWETISYLRLKEESLSLAAEFQRAGVKKGDRVGLLGNTSPEWMIGFFAVILAGGTVIPIDPKLSATEIQNILRHVEPSLLLIHPSFREVARSFRAISTQPLKVLLLKRPEATTASSVDVPLPGESDLAVISYTSGTLGNPKGVMISGRALLFEVTAVGELDQGALHAKNEVAYSILPFNHLYGLSDSAMLSFYCGMELCIAHDLSPQEISRCLVSRKVTRILAVPLFARMLMVGIKRKIEEKTGPRGKKIFGALIRIFSADFGFFLKRILFKSIHKSLGGHLRQIVCGGSALDRDTYDFFNAIGIPVYDGYGMTETGPVITVNYEGSRRRASVGKAVPGVEVRIEKNEGSEQFGEILTRGPHLMNGYYKSEAATAEMMTADGWLKTGDLGSIDSDGYLYLRGRKKSMIVLSGGKKVLPEEIESVLTQSPAFKEVCAVGMPSDNGLEEIIVVVVIPSDQMISTHAGEKQLQRAMQTEVFSRCEQLAQFKRPHRVIVRRTPFPATTSMKIKRKELISELSLAGAETVTDEAVTYETVT